MIRVFLDANVLFSASNSGSSVARLVAWLVREGTAVTSDLACAEARRNVELKRPPWLSVFESLLSGLEIIPTTMLRLPVELADKDIPILSAAIAGRCHYFATADRRDFGTLYGRTVLGVEVSSLLRLAELLRERAE